MPRPRSLTQEQLAAAALAVIDHDGLRALTMRAVAKELGMSTMALYRYVDDRDELEGHVVELILGGVETTPPPPAATWRERVETMVVRLRDTIAAHPQVIPLTLTHRHRSAGILRWSETVLEILAEAGFAGGRRAIALRALLAYVIGMIQLQHLGALSGSGTAAIAELPSDAFPYMAETARHARGVTPEAEFRGGLAAVLSGLNQ